jgi:hypothetical protein
VRPGVITLEGRAWSGRAVVQRVEISSDGGETWADATLETGSEHRWAWRRWSFGWEARAGTHELMARATDADGRTQPLDQPWNRGGFANNIVQRVRVTCLPT